MKCEGVKPLFWQAAKSTNVNHFQLSMEQIKQVNREAYDWLVALDKHEWTLHAMDPTVKCAQVTSNFVESFNNWIGPLRSAPPMTLLDEYRAKIMQMLFKRRELAEKTESAIPPRVEGVVKKLVQVSRHLFVRRAQGYEFEVVHHDVRLAVRLDDCHCDCGAWTLTGIPCVHAVAAITFIRANVSHYVDPYLRVEAWRRSVAGIVHPVPSEHVWPQMEEKDMLQPPIPKRRPGRPKKHRQRGPNDSRPVTQRSSTRTCRTCKQTGHNSRGCPGRATVAAGSSQTKTSQVCNLEIFY